MNEKELLRLEFDLYSRHHIITQAVRALARGNQLHLVDAGGRSGLIQTFMPEQNLTVVDIREPETESDKKLQAQGQYVIGSVLQMPLADASVDLALSLEMLEHMTPDERPRALAEMLRVSRMGIIFSFPQDSEVNDQAERLVNNYYKRVTGTEHPWLKEHIEQRPLPQPEQLEAALHNLGLQFVRLSSSNTYLWTLMRYYIFSTHGFQADLEKTFELYNTYLADAVDALGPSYRSIYVAVRPEFAQLLELLPEQPHSQISLPPAVLTLLDTVFDSFSSQLELKTQHIVNLEAAAQVKDGALQILEQQVTDKDTHIRNLESAQKQQEAIAENLYALLEAKDNHIRNIESIAAAHETHIVDLQTHTAQQKEHIASQTKMYIELKQTVNSKTFDLEELLYKKEEEINRLGEKLQQETNVIKGLHETIQAKDTHIRNIQSSYDEIQSFRRYFLMRWLFTWAHVLGTWALHMRQRMQHLGVALHILRTQGVHEFFKSLKRYLTGTSIMQSPLQTCAMPLNEQYKLLRESQLLNKAELNRQKGEAVVWKYQPLISIIVGIYFVDHKWLEKCLESLSHQTYQQFEILLVLHHELEAKSARTAYNWSQKDQRIRLVKPQGTPSIANVWNTGLRAATGEYTLLVTGDDELAPDALYHLVNSLQANQKVDLVYADEDTMQIDGTLINPHFKPDFNPDLLLSMNYFGHPVLFRRVLAESVGFLNPEMDGAQEFDLWLRLIAKEAVVKHVPKVLYHARVSTNPLADAFEKRSSFDFLALNALEAYAHQNKIQATVSTGLGPNTFHFQRKIMRHDLVSIIIPFKDNPDLLRQCVSSILNKTSYQQFEILLVSNNSVKRETQKTVAELVAADKRIRSLEYNVPFNYSQINNWAATQTKSDYLLLLNNDTEVISPDWLSSMMEHIQRPEVGAVGAQLLYPNNTIQHAGVILGIGGAAGHSHKYFPADLHGYFSRLCTIQNVSAVTGACLLTKKKLFDSLGGLNEKHLGISLNDIDYCLKLRKAGYLVTYTPYAKLYHHESISRGLEDSPEKKQRFARELAYFQHTWGPLLNQDPYYNPNLTLKAENFSLNVF